jgi:hypothetical protein
VIASARCRRAGAALDPVSREDVRRAIEAVPAPPEAAAAST